MSESVINVGSKVSAFGPGRCIGVVESRNFANDSYYVHWSDGTRSFWPRCNLKLVSESTPDTAGDAAWSKMAETIPLPTLKRILAKREPEQEAKRQRPPLFHDKMYMDDLIDALKKLPSTSQMVRVHRALGENLVIRFTVKPVLPDGTVVTNPISSMYKKDMSLYGLGEENPWTMPRSSATTSRDAVGK